MHTTQHMKEAKQGKRRLHRQATAAGYRRIGFWVTEHRQATNATCITAPRLHLLLQGYWHAPTTHLS